MSNARRDGNFIPAMQGVSSVDGVTPTDVWVNPLTHAVLIDSTSLYSGLDTRYATVSQATPQTIGSTGSRLTKLWATDITVTNAITGSITGNAGTVTNGVYTTDKLSVLSATASAELAGVISDETGSGSLVFATSPTLVTPVLGVATATSITATGLGQFTGGLKVDASSNTTFDALYFRNSSNGTAAVNRISLRNDTGESVIIDNFSSTYTGSVDGVNFAGMSRIVGRSNASCLWLGTETVNEPLYLATANLVRATITGAGLFGIGTTPSAKLDVGSTSGGASSGIRLIQLAENATAASSYVPIDFTVPTSGLIGQILVTASNYVPSTSTSLAANSMAVVAEATAGQLLLGAGGASGYVSIITGGYGSANERVRIISDGKVGMGGLIAPLTDLDVAGTTGVTIGITTPSVENAGILYLRRRDTSITANNNLGRIDFTGDDATAVNTVGASIRAYATGTWDGASDTPGELRFYTAAPTTGTLTQRAVIDSSGNIAVGASTALGRLHLEGAGGAIMYIVRNDSTVANGGLRLRGSDNLTDAFFSYNNEVSSSWAFGTGGGGATTKMVILDGGNVGIGTTAPGKALEINSATGANLRLTYNDSDGSATVYTDFAVSSGGDLTITPSGSDVGIGIAPSGAFHVAKSADGADTAIIVENSFTNTAASLDETASYRAFFNNVFAGRMYFGKDEDFTGTTERSAFWKLTLRLNGTETDRIHVTSAGVTTITGDTSIVGNLTLSAKNLITDTTTGMKIGTATGQKIGFWNVTPIVQPTTAVAAATFVASAGTAVNDASTFDGYTIKQVVKALRNTGLLA